LNIPLGKKGKTMSRTELNESCEASIIDQLIPGNSIALMLAPVDAGISVVGIDLMLHVASGRPWMGRSVVKGSVISYGFDGVVYDGLREAWGISQELRRLPDTYHSLSKLDLDDSDCVGRVCRDVLVRRTKGPVRLIVIDAFASPMNGSDGNFARGISGVVYHLDEIRKRTGASVLLLRHKSYGGKTNSTLPGSADVVLALSRAGKLTISGAVNGQVFLSFDRISLTSVPGSVSTIVRARPTIVGLPGESDTIH
jgi:putative DNA primase/helicase